MRLPDLAGFEARPNGHRSSRAIDRSIPSIRGVTSPPPAGLRAARRLYLPRRTCPAVAVASPVGWARAHERTGRSLRVTPADDLLVTANHCRAGVSGLRGALNPGLRGCWPQYAPERSTLARSPTF